MCQVLVMVEPRGKQAGNYKAGDVVVIVEDGHEWSPAELTHPFWRVVRIPGLPAESLRAMGLEMQAQALRRGFALDLSAGLGDLLKRTPEALTMTPRAAFAAFTQPVRRA